MVAEKESTPEKQLLGLIEKPQTKEIHRAVIRRKSFSFFSLGAIKGRLSFFQKAWEDFLLGKKKARISLDIKRINKLLRFCVFILAVYFVSSFTILALNLEKSATLSLKAKVSKQDVTVKMSSFLKNVSYYLEAVRARDIFNPLTKATEPRSGDEQNRGVDLKIAEAAKDLKLRGISWSNDPDVIIEDTKLSKTYFLKKGETICGIKIEAIFKDKILLSYKGEELELK